jgi:hypothetical protein
MHHIARRVILTVVIRAACLLQVYRCRRCCSRGLPWLAAGGSAGGCGAQALPVLWRTSVQLACRRAEQGSSIAVCRSAVLWEYCGGVVLAMYFIWCGLVAFVGLAGCLHDRFLPIIPGRWWDPMCLFRY